MMKITIMKHSLTVLKTKAQAKEILETIREQKSELSFHTSNTQKAVFTPIEGSTDFTVWEPDVSWGVDPAFQPSFQMSEADAVNRLYTLRKHYNNLWKD